MGKISYLRRAGGSAVSGIFSFSGELEFSGSLEGAKVGIPTPRFLSRCSLAQRGQ
jgi:hypothetical protein